MSALSSTSPQKREMWNWAGMFATPIRWVMGWMFLSAFLRRVVLVPAKLDPLAAEYVGHKFNHFLPHALLIQSMLEYLLRHSEVLYVSLLVFTVIEGLVGLSMLTGLGTRLGAAGVALLSGGILMGAGWIGTTCLDEWQIGATGIAAGLTIFLTGAGSWSLDSVWQRRWPTQAEVVWLRWLSSGPLFNEKHKRKVSIMVMVLAFVGLCITLITNQAFYGGVVGTLHNLSKSPHLTISQVVLQENGGLSFTLYRDGGPDTYGAFIVRVTVEDNTGNTVEVIDSSNLARLQAGAIKNDYPVKVHVGPYGLVVPLGGRAQVYFKATSPTHLPAGHYRVIVEDVSGAIFSAEVVRP